MAITKWEPLREIERFLDEDFPIRLPRMGWDLSVDVYEKENKLIAEMNLPGIAPENVEITVEENSLRISGQRQEVKEDSDRSYYSREIRRGGFERIISLPDEVKPDNAKAEYDNGLLRITMPKVKEKKEAKKIKIEAKKVGSTFASSATEAPVTKTVVPKPASKKSNK